MPHYYKTENRVQQECIIHFHNRYPKFRGCLFAVPNGGARSIREGKLLKDTGVWPGVSDLILLYKEQAWLFELKTEVGHQSKKQKIWEKLMREQGFEYFIIRDVTLFEQILETIIV